MTGWWRCLVALALWVQLAAGAAIIGIDFGTKFIKVAFVQPGKAFDIVENENSKRKSENALGLDRGARLYASDAVSLASRDPEHVFLRSRDLLGVTSSSPQVKHLEEALGIKYDLEEDEATGSFRIVLDRGTEQEQKYRPEEVVGMIFSYVRKISKAHLDAEVQDCVITVPPFFKQVQREALLNAAEIAGLNVLTLVDENVAAAVQHGIYTEFTNSSHKVLVYNMGSASTKVTLFNFWGKQGLSKTSKPTTQVEVLAKSWDETLGGDGLDMIVVDMIANAYDKMHKTDGSAASVREHRRALERIRRQANKVKTVLSANAEIPVSIESLHDGKDVRLHVTRKELEVASKDLFERVTAPVDAVLKATGTELADLHAIELIGGGIRVPRVKEILSEYFNGAELGNHLNGDEAKVFGAVFVGANMSKTFRVRPVGLTDITSDAVVVELSALGGAAADEDGEEWNKDAVLFNASSPLGARKVVSFKRESDIACTLMRQAPDGTKTPVGDYEVSGVAAAIEKFGHFGKPKISVTYQLTLNDTVVLQKAEAVFVEDIPAEEPEPEEDAEAEAAKTEGDVEADADAADGDDTEDKKSEGDGAEEGKADADEESDDKADGGDDDDKAEGGDDDKKSKSRKSRKKKKAKKPKGPSKKTHRFALTVTRPNKSLKLKPLGPEAIAEARALLKSFDDKEAEQQQHEAAKNEVEAFIFGSRDKVRSNEEDVDQVLAEEEKEKLFEDLEALEDWLDDEGSDAPISEYKARRAALDKRIKKIFRRVAELDQRPATVRAAKKLIATVRSQVAGYWAEERPWITEKETAYVLNAVETFETWLLDAEASQAAISLQEDPVLTAGDIAVRLEPLQAILEQALKRPMPRPPRKKANKKAEGEQDGSEEGEAKPEAEAGADAEAEAQPEAEPEAKQDAEPEADAEVEPEEPDEKDEL